jgi:hypothetical protein
MTQILTFNQPAGINTTAGLLALILGLARFSGVPDRRLGL